MCRVLSYVFILFVVVFESCYYDSEEDLYPTSNCSTLKTSFSNDVLPILSNSCLSCHSKASNSGNVVLDNHSSVLIYANNGALLGAIKHLSGFSAMPQGASKMNSCNIEKIESWIKGGSLNN